MLQKASRSINNTRPWVLAKFITIEAAEDILIRVQTLRNEAEFLSIHVLAWVVSNYSQNSAEIDEL